MTEAEFPYPVEICPDPVFVIGSPRSGTSILAWSLAAQDGFCTFSESDFIFHLFGQGRLDEAYRAVGDHIGGGWLAEKDVSREEFFAYLGLGLNALMTSRAQEQRWVDQSPSYTLIARRLAELFPGASFLHIVRDGRQVVSSMVNSGFEAAWAKDFRAACRTWAHFVRVASAFEVEWPDRCLTVPYADLVAAPAEWFGRMLQFIGAPPSQVPVEYFQTHRINSSYDRRSMRTGDREVVPAVASRPSDPWSSWTPEQQQIFTEEAGEVMLQHGFVPREELVR